MDLRSQSALAAIQTPHPDHLSWSAMRQEWTGVAVYKNIDAI
jgi:hypothetical protein